MSQHSFKLNGEQVLQILTGEFETVDCLRQYIKDVMFTHHGVKNPRTEGGGGVGRPKQVDLPVGGTYTQFNDLREKFKASLEQEPETFRNRKGVVAKDTAKDQTGADFTQAELLLDNGLKISFDDVVGVLVSEE